MGFRGNYEYQLDDRNRVAIPPRYREDFAAGGIITKGVERCLQLYTIDGYEEREAVLRSVPSETEEGRKARRAFSGNAFDAQKDNQGRVLIPQSLIDYAGLDSQVVVVGAMECLEIWDRSLWQEQQPDLDETVRDVLQKIGELKSADPQQVG
jgi:MraZ protein